MNARTGNHRGLIVGFVARRDDLGPSASALTGWPLCTLIAPPPNEALPLGVILTRFLTGDAVDGSSASRPMNSRAFSGDESGERKSRRARRCRSQSGRLGDSTWSGSYLDDFCFRAPVVSFGGPAKADNSLTGLCADFRDGDEVGLGESN